MFGLSFITEIVDTWVWMFTKIVDLAHFDFTGDMVSDKEKWSFTNLRTLLSFLVAILIAPVALMPVHSARTFIKSILGPVLANA